MQLEEVKEEIQDRIVDHPQGVGQSDGDKKVVNMVCAKEAGLDK